MAVEPIRADARPCVGRTGALRSGAARGFVDAVIGPFIAFFRVYGWLALLMLAMISLYRLPEFVMGPMANPFYHDLGLSKDAVGAIRGIDRPGGDAYRHRGGRNQRACVSDTCAS